MLAEKYAKAENKDVVIYRKADGTFGFMDADAPERQSVAAVELVPALL